jgi:hypothetical protein
MVYKKLAFARFHSYFVDFGLGVWGLPPLGNEKSARDVEPFRIKTSFNILFPRLD